MLLIVLLRRPIEVQKYSWLIRCLLQLSRLILSTIDFLGFGQSDGKRTTSFSSLWLASSDLSRCRAFVYLTNLLYGLSLEQTVAIVSERGEIKGRLKIIVQQLPIAPAAVSPKTNSNRQNRSFRNTSGLTKINFDDETYFQVELARRKNRSIDLDSIRRIWKVDH